MTKPAVIFITPTCPGAGSPDINLPSHALSEAGFDVTTHVFQNSCEATIPNWFAPPTKIHYSNSNRIEFVRGIRRTVKANHHATLYVADGSMTAYAWLASKWLHRGKVVYHQQNFIEPRLLPSRSKWEGKFAKQCDLIVLNEPNRRRFFQSYHRLDGLSPQFRVVPTYLPRRCPLPDCSSKSRNELRNRFHLDSQADVLLHIGVPSERRMWQEQFKGLAEVPKHLTLAYTGVEPGDSRAKRLTDYVRSCAPNVSLLPLGRLPFEDMLKISSMCDLGILSYPDDRITNYYQSPGRLTQYLRAGLSINAPKYPGLELLNLTHQIGNLFDQESATSFANSIQKTLSDLNDTNRKRLQSLCQDTLFFEKAMESVIRWLSSGT